MKNLTLYSILFLTFSFISCDNNENTGEEQIEQIGYRVKRIEGKDYQILFNYEGNKLISANKCDLNEDILKRDTLGYFYINYEAKALRTLLYDYAYKINPVKVKKIKETYPDTFKEILKANKFLAISYSKRYRTDVRIEEIKKDTQTPYNPNSSHYDYEYHPDFKQENSIEYDNNGNVVIFRQFYDKYELREVEYEPVYVAIRTVNKYEFTYDNNNRLIGVKLFQSDVGNNDNNWNQIDNYVYTYQNNSLISIESQNYNMVRNGNNVTLTENGKTTLCTMDSNGNAVKIEYPDGSSENVEYEKGNGNYRELVYPMNAILLGKCPIH